MESLLGHPGSGRDGLEPIGSDPVDTGGPRWQSEATAHNWTNSRKKSGGDFGSTGKASQPLSQGVEEAVNRARDLFQMEAKRVEGIMELLVDQQKRQLDQQQLWVQQLLTGQLARLSHTLEGEVRERRVVEMDERETGDGRGKGSVLAPLGISPFGNRGPRETFVATMTDDSVDTRQRVTHLATDQSFVTGMGTMPLPIIPLSAASVESDVQERLKDKREVVQGLYKELQKEGHDTGVRLSAALEFAGILGSQYSLRAIGQKRCFDVEWATKLVESDWFNTLATLVNSLTVIFIAVITDEAMKKAKATYTQTPFDDSNDVYYRFIDYAFFTFFFVELVLRILGEEVLFVIGPNRSWNVLDAVALVTQLIEIWPWNTVDSSNLFYEVRWFRVIRICRLVRRVRTLRRMTLIILGSATSLLWACCLLAAIIWIFCVLLLQILARYTEETQPDDPLIEEIMVWFSDFPTTILSLAMAVTGGVDWGDMSAVLLRVDNFSFSLFLIYVTLMVLGVLNIITGIFVQGADELIKSDRDLASSAQIQKTSAQMHTLTKLFKELDTNRTKMITLDEFKEYGKDEDVRALFGAIGLDLKRPEEIFRLIDADEDGALDIAEFVLGCISLQGDASAASVETLKYDMRDFMKQWRRQTRTHKNYLKHIQQCMDFLTGNNIMQQMTTGRLDSHFYDGPLSPKGRGSITQLASMPLSTSIRQIQPAELEPGGRRG